MYSLFQEKGPGFAAVHYARSDERCGLLTPPRPLGFTTVTIPKPKVEPVKMFLPPRPKPDMRIELAAKHAHGDCVEDLSQLVDRGRHVLRGLLSRHIVLQSETTLLPRMRVRRPEDREIPMSEGGLIIATEETMDDLLKEQWEFDRWVATPEEIEAMNSIERVADDFREPLNEQPPRTGLYL